MPGDDPQPPIHPRGPVTPADPTGTEPEPPDADRPEWGGEVSGRFPEWNQATGHWEGARITGGSVDTPAGRLSRDLPEPATDHPPGEENQRLRQTIASLRGWLDHLRHATEPHAIIEAIVAALQAADTVPGTADLGSQTRAWHAVGESDGSPESFHEARDILIPALDRVLLVAEQLKDTHSTRQRRTHDGTETLNHLDLESERARHQITWALSRASSDELAAAIDNLSGKTGGADIIAAAILVFTAVGDELFGTAPGDRNLTEERGEWAALHEYSGAPGRFTEARDHLAASARELHAALVPWRGSAMTADASEQFVAMLVHSSQQARGLLSHLTAHNVQAYSEIVSQLASAGDSAAIAAAVSTMLEHADKLFHEGTEAMDHAVAAELASWLNVGTSPGDLATARDHIVVAANEFERSLQPYLYRLVDDRTRSHLLRPLVQAVAQARH